MYINGLVFVAPVEMQPCQGRCLAALIDSSILSVLLTLCNELIHEACVWPPIVAALTLGRYTSKKEDSNGILSTASEFKA